MNMKFLLKIAGKDSLSISKEVSFFYLLHIILQYGFMMIRGKMRFPFKKKIFIGKNVKILERKKLRLGTNIKMHNNVYIDCLSKNGVSLEDNVILGRNSRIECTGSIADVGKGINIGAGSTFGNDCFFGAAGGIDIGKDNICGQYIRFHSENHNFNKKDVLIKKQGVSHKGIKIGDNNWIGAGVVFLDGAEIGNGCVVAANAVVSGKFGDNQVIGGIPAKRIKDRR